jgi:hypothetical protein
VGLVALHSSTAPRSLHHLSVQTVAVARKRLVLQSAGQAVRRQALPEPLYTQAELAGRLLLPTLAGRVVALPVPSEPGRRVDKAVEQVLEEAGVVPMAAQPVPTAQVHPHPALAVREPIMAGQAVPAQLHSSARMASTAMSGLA